MEKKNNKKKRSEEGPRQGSGLHWGESEEWSSSAGKIQDLLETGVSTMRKLQWFRKGLRWPKGDRGLLRSNGGRGWPRMGEAQRALPRRERPVWTCSSRQRKEARESDGSAAVAWVAGQQRLPPLWVAMQGNTFFSWIPNLMIMRSWCLGGYSNFCSLRRQTFACTSIKFTHERSWSCAALKAFRPDYLIKSNAHF